MVGLFTVILFFVVAFLAGLLAVGAGWMILQRRSQQQLIEPGPESLLNLEDSPILLRVETLSTISAWSGLLASFNFFQTMRTHIAEAGLNWSVGRVTALMLLCGSVALALLMRVSWLPLLVVLGVTCLAAFVPYLYVTRRRATRFMKFEEQFPDALDFLSRALRAGHPLATTLEMLANENTPPLSVEIRKTCDERQLGMSTEQALQNFARRVPLLDVRMFVAAVQLHSRAGGRLTDVFERLAETMRERVALKGEIRSISAHGRLSGMVLTILPAVVAGVLLVVNPEHFRILLSHEWGKYIILGAIGCLALAHLVIRKIVRIPV